MAAELNYLSAIEESVRQLSDVERVRGISLAQQESVSLAQIIKVFVEFSSFFFFFFVFVGPHLRHMEVPRSGVESEL